MTTRSHQVVILTGAYDDQHLRTRTDNPVVCTSAGKRLMLYRAISDAAGAPPLLLSPQPRGRSKGNTLPEVACQFGEFRQLFSRASGIRKVRYVLDILRYIDHVHRNTRDGEIIIFDNYELIYVLAIYYCRLLGRSNPILLEYEDGKHAIDRGLPKLISGFAERIGRTLVQGAILATPTLGERLPREIPKILVPGILRDGIIYNAPPGPGDPVSFLYSGSLDVERGGPLLLSFLEEGNFPPCFNIHITGQGHYVDRLIAVQNRYPKVIHFHGTVSQSKLEHIRSLCHYGLNLQSSRHPVSAVTYPSKTFDYLNAGLRVISTRAAGVPDVLGNSALYLDNETPAALARTITQASDSLRNPSGLGMGQVGENFTTEGTVRRLSTLLRLIQHS